MSDQWDGDVGHEERYLLNLLEDDRLTRDDLSRAMNRIRHRMMSRPAPEVKDAPGVAKSLVPDPLTGLSDCHDLNELTRQSIAAFNALSPEQQEEMLRQQRESWVRGEMELSRLEKAQPTTPAPAAASDGLVERLRGLRVHIEALGIGCCTCGVKTFQVDFHDANCKVRNVAEALDSLDVVEDRIEADAAEMERKDARIAEEQLRGGHFKAERDALREALEPFAKLAGEMFRDGGGSDYEDDRAFWGFNSVDLTYGDLRRVRAALRPEAKGGREYVG